MDRVNCSVNECSHNGGGLCFSNRVNIGGLSAFTNEDTCCGAFLNKQIYGTLINNTNGDGPCSALICNVPSCVYNKNSTCNLSSIDIVGNDPKIYTETHCNSFKRK